MEKRFTDIFINRPVFATCISLVILLAGILAFFKMDVRLFPRIDTSMATITIQYPGASSEVMEGFVAQDLDGHTLPCRVDLFLAIRGRRDPRIDRLQIS